MYCILDEFIIGGEIQETSKKVPGGGWLEGASEYADDDSRQRGRQLLQQQWRHQQQQCGWLGKNNRNVARPLGGYRRLAAAAVPAVETAAVVAVTAAENAGNIAAAVVLAAPSPVIFAPVPLLPQVILERLKELDVLET